MKMNYRDHITDMAMKRWQEMDRDPVHKMLRRQLDEEQRNPGLRIARERQIQENSNPFLRIARDRINEQQRLDSLYHVSARSVRDFDRFSVYEQLRAWERKLPDWILNPRSQAFIAFEPVIGHLSAAQRMAERFSTTPHIELRALDRLQDWDRFSALSREISNAFRSFPPEMNNTFLVRANEKLELIRESAENRDATRLDEEFESFIGYVLSWLKSLGSKVLTRDAALAILVTVVIAALQQAQSYKWRLDDKKDADLLAKLQNEKLDSILKALIDKRKEQQLALGKPYSIRRTTPAFARPGSKQRVVGYVYARQPVLAIATTGRWILVEWTDPFSLEKRSGWIRKKYAKLNTHEKIGVIPEKINLLLAVNFYERGELSLGQAAKFAGLSKRDFIDVLGQHQVPVINYSPDELREEIGV